MYGRQPRELQKHNDRRWARRHFACHNIMDRLPAVLCVLEDIADERDGEGYVEASGHLSKLTYLAFGF